jgi:hypothetical protein
MLELLNPKDTRINKLQVEDRAFHDWYRFVLSFPPHLVKEYIEKLNLTSASVLLDPFCGTGTTLVEAKKNYIPSIGIEANPMAHFASMVKTKWDIDFVKLLDCSEKIFKKCLSRLEGWHAPLKCFNEDQESLVLANSINPIPLHKCFILYEEITKNPLQDIRNIQLLALATVCVYSASNLKFGPEVYVSNNKRIDAPVFEDWIDKIRIIAEDLQKLNYNGKVKSFCHLADSRNLKTVLKRNSIDAVITSPPYPNEKDYTRTTRLESTLLGFINSKKELRALKENLIRSNTRNVYIADLDDKLLGVNHRIDKISKEIERRRISLNKTSGFERQYHRVVKLYFGGMKRHLEDLKFALKPGARLAYVVGDQASYLQVLIRTGEILGEIASELGYDIVSIDLFRTRLSTVTGQYLREEVLVLEWNGG